MRLTDVVIASVVLGATLGLLFSSEPSATSVPGWQAIATAPVASTSPGSEFR